MSEQTYEVTPKGYIYLDIVSGLERGESSLQIADRIEKTLVQHMTKLGVAIGEYNGRLSWYELLHEI